MIDCALITDDETLRRHVRSLVQGPDSPDRLVLELNESASDLPRERVTDVLAANPHLRGLNVTIPFKQAVMPLLHAVDPIALERELGG